MDEMMNNEVLAEDIRADFYEAIKLGEWNDARAMLAQLEDMKENTYTLRREMNLAMAEDANESEAQDHLEKNNEWLSEHGLTDSDVMEDDNGSYVYVENEDGLKKTYLPFANETDLIF